jgi:elongation factor G
VDRMLREFKVSANVGKPRVAYRETITQPVRSEGRFVRQTGGRGHYGHVVLDLEPLGPGEGFAFVDASGQGAIPKEFVPSIEEGTREAMESGVLAGYPLVDLRAILVDGSFHEEDSSELAFKVAASIALRDGVQKAGPVLLEPVMAAEIVAPEEFVGEIVGDLSARRAQIEGLDLRPAGIQAVRAYAPLAEMFGYATDLRSMTQGRGTFTMEFAHYAQVDRQIADRVLYGWR